MGKMVQFPSNGDNTSGYLATPSSGKGPGVLVIQEWWGLVDHIKRVCDRFAAEGFTALAPDLYQGKSTGEPDEAGKLMMTLNLDRASKDMGGAVDYLKSSDAVRGRGVGVVGFCMGGGLALKLAVQSRPEPWRYVLGFEGPPKFAGFGPLASADSEVVGVRVDVDLSQAQPVVHFDLLTETWTATRVGRELIDTAPEDYRLLLFTE